MIDAVVDSRNRSVQYVERNNLFNVCAERDMLNAQYPMLDQPYIVVCGVDRISQYCCVSYGDILKACRG